MMVDNRILDIRALYKTAIYDFLYTYLPKNYIEDRYMPHAHLATVLLKMYKELESLYHEKKKGPKAINLSAEKKEKTPVLVIDAIKLGTFLHIGVKGPIMENVRLFLVAFPGLDVSEVPVTRDTGIEKAAKRKGGNPYTDGPIKQDQ